jgi:hypothetical protein
MSPSEQSSDESATTSISLTISNLELPDAEDQRKALLANLEETLTTLLATDFDQPTAEVDARVGHHYATVSPTCPDCGEALDIRGIHLGDDTEAFAVARCSTACSWTGDAVFALIDLDESVAADYESSVFAGKIRPEYHCYSDRDLQPD